MLEAYRPEIPGNQNYLKLEDINQGTMTKSNSFSLEKRSPIVLSTTGLGDGEDRTQNVADNHGD